MEPHCQPNQSLRNRAARMHSMKTGNAAGTGRRQAEEALLRRIKCYLMTELDNQDQTHLKIYVSLAMPTTLKDLASDIPFHIDDQRHTLRVTTLSGTGLPRENNWLATVYRGTATNGVIMASASLGFT